MSTDVLGDVEVVNMIMASGVLRKGSLQVLDQEEEHWGCGRIETRCRTGP